MNFKIVTQNSRYAGIIGLVIVLIVLSVCIAGCGSNVPPPMQKKNLSDAEKKLSPDLLPLTDDKYVSSGMTRQVLELQMEKEHQLMYIDEKGHITQDPATGYPLVYVYIKTKEDTNPDIINSYVWNVTDRDPANRIVVAWVDVRKIRELASLEEIQSLQTVVQPISRG